MGKKWQKVTIENSVTLKGGFLNKASPVLAEHRDNLVFIAFEKSDWMCKAATDTVRSHAPLKNANLFNTMRSVVVDLAVAKDRLDELAFDPMMALADEGPALAGPEAHLSTPPKGTRTSGHKRKGPVAMADEFIGDVPWTSLVGMGGLPAPLQNLLSQSGSVRVLLTGRRKKSQSQRIYVEGGAMGLILEILFHEVGRNDVPEVFDKCEPDETWPEWFSVCERVWHVRLPTGAVRSSSPVGRADERGEYLSAEKYNERKEVALHRLKDRLKLL